MHKLPSKQVTEFQKKILTWYAEHQRDLPWRKTRDPYKILVSEIMLQQTQVNRVIPKYEAWLQAFPTVKDLANAPVSEVLKHWSGLGYNRRALNLKKTAQVVAEKYNGTFPDTEKELLDLPGIGHYTARAVLCFAFDKQVAVVDTNVRKVVLVHFFPERIRQLAEKSKGVALHDAANKTSLTDKDLTEFAAHLLPHGKAYEWNQALMDYASAVLKKEKIPLPKQSTFKGSRRYYRGQILKVLLEKKSVPVIELGTLIKKDFKESENFWLKKLLEELEKEGFVIIKEEQVELTS